MLDKVDSLEALFEKGIDGWTKKERDRFKDMDGLYENLQVVRKNVSSVEGQLNALHQQKTTYEELLTIFQRRKTQLQHELDQIVENLLASSRLHKEIVTLQDFERFGIPLKESPRNELLASM